MRLKGKVAVITGAGSGIGKASAKIFAKEGAKIVVVGHSDEKGRKVAEEIKADGGEAIFLNADVSRSDDAKRMVDTAVNTFGKLDILFNNAGIAGVTLDKLNEEEWRKVMDVNVTGPYLACMHAMPVMRKQGSGVILFTSSTGGHKASGRSPAYSTSKAAILMLSKALARALAKDNIRVNTISPGTTDTPLSDAFMEYPANEEERRIKEAAKRGLIPMGRTASPEEQAYAALFLASDEASYITGIDILVDGGKSA
ncbi:SDR family NAD(P)-dependent oxidoreductase [Chloroflexota bacterium]